LHSQTPFCWSVWGTDHFHSILNQSSYYSKGQLTYSPPFYDLKHLMGRPHLFSTKAWNYLNFSKIIFSFFRKNTHVKREKSSMKFKIYLAPAGDGNFIEMKSLWTSSSRFYSHHAFPESNGSWWCFPSMKPLHTPSKNQQPCSELLVPVHFKN